MTEVTENARMAVSLNSVVTGSIGFFTLKPQGASDGELVDERKESV